MKSFFEEYGFIALAAIVVVLLIAMATPVGTAIKNSVLGLVDKFGSTTNDLVNEMANDAKDSQGEIAG